MPYPGRWISSELDGRIAKTALVRAIVGPDHAANFRIWTHGRREARAYAEQNAPNYARLLNFWPSVIDGLWNDEALAQAVIKLSATKERATSAKGAGLANAAKPAATPAAPVVAQAAPAATRAKPAATPAAPVVAQAAPAATRAAPAPAPAVSHEAPSTHESAMSGKEEE